LLKRGRCEGHTRNNLRDALILLRVTRPELGAAAGTRQAFDTACARVPVVELGREFCTLDAGEAGSRLLENIQARLQPNPALDS
jgi:hypothetical protein